MAVKGRRARRRPGEQEGGRRGRRPSRENLERIEQENPGLTLGRRASGAGSLAKFVKTSRTRSPLSRAVLASTPGAAASFLKLELTLGH